MTIGLLWMVQLQLCMPTAVAADLTSLPVPERVGKTGEEPWLKQAKEHILTPTTDRVKPVCVTRTEGKVEGADALLGEDRRSCRLTYENGGVKPVVILDFGEQETLFELMANPHFVAAAGIAFRAKDARNAYTAELALDGVFKLRKRIDGKDTVISDKKLPEPLIDGRQYKLEISAIGPALTTRLDGTVIDGSRDDTFATGRVGFYTPKEKWPLFDYIIVRDGKGQKLLTDDFSGDLSKWQFARTLSCVVDGGERDRLLWTGDLYFGQRNVYYAFANPTYLRDSLKMMAFNQTPEGYVHASPYAERSVPPPSGDFGPFPSDEFAAWLAPVGWDHLLYTDDVETLKQVYPAIKRLEKYLGSRIGGNGLFVQRPETSKHACNLELGDVRTRSYVNILLWGVFRDTARIANRLGLVDDAQASQKKADVLKKAIFERLWDETNGCFREALETPKSGSEANALALSMRFVTPEQAMRIAQQLKKSDHGKFQSLASRGRFEYGFGQSGTHQTVGGQYLDLALLAEN